MAAYFNEPDNSAHRNDGGPNSEEVSGSILTSSPVSRLLAFMYVSMQSWLKSWEEPGGKASSVS